MNIDNDKYMDSTDALSLIKQQFNALLPMFRQENEYDKGNYCGFGVEYVKNGITIFVGGSQGGMDYSVVCDGKEYYLPDFDSRLRCAYALSKANILILFDILSDFIKYTTNNKQ